MKEVMQLVLELILEYTNGNKHYYDTLREIFILICEVEYMFEFEPN